MPANERFLIKQANASNGVCSVRLSRRGIKYRLPTKWAELACLGTKSMKVDYSEKDAAILHAFTADRLSNLCPKRRSREVLPTGQAIHGGRALRRGRRPL